MATQVEQNKPGQLNNNLHRVAEIPNRRLPAGELVGKSELPVRATSFPSRLGTEVQIYADPGGWQRLEAAVQGRSS